MLTRIDKMYCVFLICVIATAVYNVVTDDFLRHIYISLLYFLVASAYRRHKEEVQDA